MGGRKVLELVIHLEDHKHDSLGRIFLDPGDESETRRSLRAYLGPRVSIKGTTLDGQRLRVRIEVANFQVESDNLVRLARGLAGRARMQAARAQLEEALKLYPLNASALKALGRAACERADYARATAFFVRANEVLGEDGESLRTLGTISLRQGREPSALAYFERALRLNPRDEAAGRARAELRARMEMKFHGSHDGDTPEPAGPGGRRPRPRGR